MINFFLFPSGGHLHGVDPLEQLPEAAVAHDVEVGVGVGHGQLVPADPAEVRAAPPAGDLAGGLGHRWSLR